ncbi:MAG: hypothetical protein ACREIA_09750 [Opitutaceae bacterium]
MSAQHVRRVLFRLDFSRRTGWGHLARCAALAGELRSRGWECVLCTDGDLAGAPPELRDVYHRVVSAGPGWELHPPKDVRAGDWIVVDDYSVGDLQLRQLAKALSDGNLTRRPRVLVMDDEGHRRLDAADLVLNSRLGLERSPYAPEVAALLGTRFALLRPGLARPESVTLPLPTGADGVLIMLGGTDPRGFTPVVIEALGDIDPARFCPVIVRARETPDAGVIRRALDRFAVSVWLERLDASSLAGWARCCSFAVSAAGGALYELALLRLPFVAIVVAENQRALAAEVRTRWRLPVVDVEEDVRGAVATAFRALIASNETARREALARIPIDTRGPARVAEMMEKM